jgi:chromosome segregation ATPase
MRIYFYISILLFVNVQVANSQGSEKLLQERQALMEQLEEAENQTSSLLGKKSKKDLRNTTEILKDIIQKDTEIIAALRREINRKEATQPTAAASPENDEKILELENQLTSLNNQANQRNIKTAELEQEVATVKNRMFKYQSTILITFFIIFLLAIYISRLRKKAKRETA